MCRGFTSPPKADDLAEREGAEHRCLSYRDRGIAARTPRTPSLTLETIFCQPFHYGLLPRACAEKEWNFSSTAARFTLHSPALSARLECFTFHGIDGGRLHTARFVACRPTPRRACGTSTLLHRWPCERACQARKATVVTLPPVVSESVATTPATAKRSSLDTAATRQLTLFSGGD